MAIRRRTQRGHRFTESPVLQLALQGWRSRMVGLLLICLLYTSDAADE